MKKAARINPDSLQPVGPGGKGGCVPAPGRAFAFWTGWLPLVCYMLVLFVQSSFPAPKTVPTFVHSDKLLHMAAYGMLTALFVRAFRLSRPWLSPGKLYCRAAMCAVGYGVTDEIHQCFIPDRTGDVLDLAADIVGSVVAAVLMYLVVRRFSRPRA